MGSEVSPGKLFMEPLRKDNPPPLSRHSQLQGAPDPGQGNEGTRALGFRGTDKLVPDLSAP